MQSAQAPRFALVTGASRGIGAEYATALASRGYDVLLVARDKARLAAVAEELTRRYPVQVRAEVVDLAGADAAQQLFVAARRYTDAVDLVVHNAGFGLFGPFVEVPLPRIREMLHLHVQTVVETTRLFLPSMCARRSGGMITVASTAGLFAVPFMAEYAATKAFLISFSLGVAEEVRPFGVRMQVCCPGSTETEFHVTAGFRPRNPLGTDSPHQVVEASLRGLVKGRDLMMIGWRGRLLWLMSRYLPHSILTKAAGRWLKTSSGAA